MQNFQFVCRITCVVFLLNLAHCFSITNTTNIITLNEQFNISSDDDVATKWLLKTVFPSYLQEFLELSNFPGATKILNTDNNTDIEQFLEHLLDGVTNRSCKAHVTEWFWRILPDNWKDIGLENHKWVLQLVDSWGKLPEGVLSGHVNLYGDFHECIQITVKDLEILNDILPPEDNRQAVRNFEGQYCTAYISDYDAAMRIAPKPVIIDHSFSKQITRESAVSVNAFLKMLSNLNSSVAICLPNSCSHSQVQQILVNSFYMTYSLIASPAGVNLTDLPWPVTGTCSDARKPPLSTGAIAMISVLAFFVTLSLATGAIDYWHTCKERMSATPQAELITRSVNYKYLMTFSIYTNLKRLFSTKRTTSENFDCLHGIRFLSIVWVVLAHTYNWFIRGPQWNRIDLNNAYKDWSILAVINGTFSVDTLFVTSGLLVTYNTLKMLDKNEGRFNILLFYIHKYVRFTPTYGILIGIAATLYSYMGSGPQWHYMESYEKQCRENWWRNLLYINNLVDSEEKMCHHESWYLAADMQFYIALPFFVYPVWKWEFMGVLLLGIYTVMSCITPVLVSRYAFQAPAMIERINAHNIQMYVRPWSRLSAFLVGVWLGGFLHKIKGIRFRIPLLFNLLFWLFAAFVAGVVVFSIKSWFEISHEITRLHGYFYAGLSRLCWALAVSWVIFACVKGYGGIINKFLSWKAFIPLGRLSFCVYLISFHIQSIFHLRLSIPIKWDAYTMTNLFFAHLFMSYLVGFVCCLFLECPFVALQKLIFEGKGEGGGGGEAPKKIESQTD